jgi:nucleoside-diphosphate-sugar epimerase
MKVFVTGAGGFIGSHFIEHALAQGHEVAGIYRSDSEPRRELIARLRTAGADLHQGDVTDPASVESALSGADAVCHFAAAFTESGQEASFFHRVNVLGTGHVARIAAERGVRRFVHCSTAGIYGRTVAGVVNEATPTRPWNEYERTKLLSEQVVRDVARNHGMEYVILRPAVVYGPRDPRLRKMFRLAARGRFPLFGSGKGRRHFVYVTDVAEAFLLACTQPGAANREMIVAGCEALPLREILGTLAAVSDRARTGPRLPLRPMLALAALTEDLSRLIGIRPPLSRRNMDFYLNDAAFDCSLAREALGWEPKMELREGLLRTRQSYDLEAAPRMEWSPPPLAPSGARAPSSQR